MTDLHRWRGDGAWIRLSISKTRKYEHAMRTKEQDIKWSRLRKEFDLCIGFLSFIVFLVSGRLCF